MNSKVCAVIVTYNRLDLLKGAIDSLRNQSFPCDIVVVNNGSTDGTTEYLANLSATTEVEVINQENVGGAGGFFTGIKYAAEHNYDFVWAMDDGIIAQNNTLEELCIAYEKLSQKQKIGFLCSVVYSGEGEVVNTPILSDEKNSTQNRKWPHYLEEGIVQIESATFVSVFIPIPVVYEVGLPIKEFFIWGDDTEYTLRISRKYPSFAVGKSKISHLRNGGALDLRTMTDKNRIIRFSNLIRNNGYVNKKYFGKQKFMTQLLAFSKQTVQFLFSGQFLKAKVALKGMAKAITFNPQILFPTRNN